MRVPIEIQAMSRSDDACFLGQKAVADAAEADANYRIVGGNMVRMLGEVYPAPRAFSRSTVDVDAAVDEVEVIGSIADRLKADSFHQESGNLFVKSVTPQRRIEVNLLMPYRGPSQGKSVRAVPGLGQVDTFPELTFAMAQAPLELDMTVTLTNKEEVLTYTTFIPSLESAVILKAHAWKGRLEDKDLVDLCSLLEIRDAHPDTPWRLDVRPLRATRRTASHILHNLLRPTLERKGRVGGREWPRGFDRLRTASLIRRHVTTA